MSLLGRLALLFVIVPIVELVLLIELGQLVGLLPTLALVVFTGVAGAWMARAEGLRVFFRFQRELASGRLPGQAMLDGLSVLVGGAFLLTPGVLTDVAGFSLLVPVTRRWIQRGVRRRLQRGIADGSIRVVTMGSAGMWGFGGRSGGADDRAGRAGEEAADAEVGAPGSGAVGGWEVEEVEEGAGNPENARPGRRLDPSKGIVIEPDDG